MERSKEEQKWLEAIAKAEFPVTLVWGVGDTVSPLRVANYVWREYLMQRPSRNRLYYIPDANHYSQVDRPDAYAQAVLDAFDADPDQLLGFLGENRPAAPLLVDVTREHIPVAADLLPANNPNGSQVAGQTRRGWFQSPPWTPSDFAWEAEGPRRQIGSKPPR